ncbi:MAG: recombinase family protein [Candidatus Angelobacter sp. Gp1-AA117]|nr:MAG: recombinase family protein [Candidatus Angelobacter sp. Gp1-AA117]
MSKIYYAYTRVSDSRQGEGVSLTQQLDAIERYASRQGLKIVEHFEEQKTAAKRGRPVFSKMLRLLKAGKASGVLMHKIDRSARNLKDWAELGELIDSGTEVHFVNESLDLSSRGGRLSADIQAVVAADYIRNLREETKKGFYGRLKQGFYPMPAPLGYLNAGAGKPKTPDPERAPLIKKAFELYATGRYSQMALGEELYQFGLRKKNGKRLDQNTLGRILRSPFYMGLIRIEKTNETYLGLHQPLISKRLFEQVQKVLSGNFTASRVRHDFPFRQLFWCKLCGRTLIPETQKGHVYYRCQNKQCPTKCIRQEPLEKGVLEKLLGVDLSPEQHEYLKGKFDEFQQNRGQKCRQAIEAAEIQLSQVKDRLNRLTDAYLDNAVDNEIFEERKTALLMERRGIEDRIQDLKNGSPDLPKKLDRLLELLKSPYLQYISGSPDERKELIQNVCSNRTLAEKTLEISYALPFDQVAFCLKNTSGAPSRRNARMWDKLALFLFNFVKKTEEGRE